MSTLGAGPFLYRVWFRDGNANKIHWASIESIIPFCPEMSNKYNSCKGGFFSESAIRFFKSPNLQKKIFQKTILSLKFKFPANNILLLLVGNLNFKLRIVFWNIYFEIWRFEKH